MAVSWGPWDYGSGSPPRGMRVGIETSFSTVTNASTTVTAYYDVWTQNDLTWGGDAQQFDFDANFDGAETYSFQNNGDDPETKMRVTKSYKFTYPSTSYGSSPADADFGAEVNNTYNGMNPTHAVHVPIPARPYGTPTAPDTCKATRVSDTSASVSWERNATTGKPYTATWLERYVYNYSGWARIATLSGTATSYSDTGVVANRKYAYRVQADNSVGTSGYSQAPAIFTTPAAPTAVVRTQSGTDQVLTWDVAVGYTEYTTEIWRAVNGAWTLLTTYAPEVTTQSGSHTYTDTTSLSSTQVKYRLRTKTTSGTVLYSAYSAETTETAGVLTAPSAPTLLVPSTGTLDPTEAIQHSWKHNPTDGSAQTAFQVQYRYVGDTTWIQTGKITGTASSWTMPANTVVKGRQVEWQVQTWGGSATASSFSTTAVWTTSPVIAIKYPVYLDLTSGRLEADSAAIKALPSGIWNTALQLDKFMGTDNLAGLPIYVDTEGKLRAQPHVIYPVTSKNAADVLNTYPVGVSLLTLTGAGAAAGGWPYGVSAMVLSMLRMDSPITASNSGFQIWCRNSGTNSPTTEMQFRTGTSLGWSSWSSFAGHDTGWVDGGTGTSVFTANATNFTLASSMGRVRGGVNQIYITGSMKVATSAPGTTGDIGNLNLGTVAAMFGFSGGGPYRPLSSGQIGRPVNTYIDGGGGIGLASIGGSSALAVSETISFGGTFLV